MSIPPPCGAGGTGAYLALALYVLRIVLWHLTKQVSRNMTRLRTKLYNCTKQVTVKLIYIFCLAVVSHSELTIVQFIASKTNLKSMKEHF